VALFAIVAGEGAGAPGPLRGKKQLQKRMIEILVLGRARRRR
jgi:hypothetical protein